MRLLHKTEVETGPEEPFAISFYLKPSVSGHPRAVFGHYDEQYHLLLQHLVMQQVVQDCKGNGIGPGRQENRGTLNPMRGLRTNAADEQRQRQCDLI